MVMPHPRGSTGAMGEAGVLPIMTSPPARNSPEINPEGPQGPLKMKVLRGGSWVNSIEGVKVVKRARNYSHIKNEIYGFRTVLPIP